MYTENKGSTMRDIKNPISSLIQSHRSIRRYTDAPIPDEVLQDILDSAQWAPSHHNVQAYSIIIVKDKEKKKILSKYCASQKYVESCPVFLVFCADFHRLHLACEMNGKQIAVDEVENLLIGAVDTALVAQNVLITARSYGLGGVMIGGIRNEPENVVNLLKLPSLTIPIMGMCLGYPYEIPWQKPRLPIKTVIHEEEYQDSLLMEGLREYEEITARYYTDRTKGKRTIGWTKQISEYISYPRRPELTTFIKRQGFKCK